MIASRGDTGSPEPLSPALPDWALQLVEVSRAEDAPVLPWPVWRDATQHGLTYGMHLHCETVSPQQAVAVTRLVMALGQTADLAAVDRLLTDARLAVLCGGAR
jgi:hypothetical protein